MVSVNVGAPTEMIISGRRRQTGIVKVPQTGRVPVRGATVGSDVQIDKKHHGGPYKAAYVYASEDYAWWSEQLRRELTPGTFGDNITTVGLDVTHSKIGERWRMGTAVLEVTDPRIPCSTLATRMGIQGFVKRFAAAERFGAYCRIAEEGDVAAGDAIEVLHRPSHPITIVDVAHAYYSNDPQSAPDVYRAAGLPQHYLERIT